MDDIFIYTPGAPSGAIQIGQIRIIVPEESFIKSNSPIVLEIVDFAINSNSSVKTALELILGRFVVFVCYFCFKLSSFS